MQAIRNPDMETVKRRRMLDALSIGRRILVPQDRASQTSSEPLNNPLPRNVVAMPNTTPERRVKRSLWPSFPSPCFNMALAYR